MGQRLVQSLQQFVDSSSVVLAGGTCSVFEAGTTTLVPLFSDVDLTIAENNPFTYDAAGMAPDIFYADAISIKQEIKDSEGTLFRTADDIPGRGGPTAGVSIWAADQTYIAGEEVVFNAIRYTSNISNNKGNTPTSADVNWTRSPFQGVYNANLTYVTTERVIDPLTGILFISRTDDNTGNTPSTSPVNWANGSGIGLQTINLPGSTLNLPSSNAAASSAAQIGVFVVVTKEFDGTADENAQFSIDMPESWDQGDLQVAYKLVSRTAVAGGSSAVFGISTVGFESGETITDQTSFGTITNTTITGITDQDNFYFSATTTFIPNNINSANQILYFQVTRVATDANDDITSDIGLVSVRIFYTTVSGADNA